MKFMNSASKHGVERADAFWAVEHAMLFKPSFQRSRLVDMPDSALFVGPDRNGRLIEIMAVRLEDEIIIFHAMSARRMFRDMIVL